MIPYLVWIAILIGAISWFIFNMTRHGKYMYAIGANPQAAEVAGVPVKLTMVMIYAKAAAFYGLAGFMLGAKSGGASVNLGLGYEALQFLGVNANAQWIALGIIIYIAISLDIRKYVAKK